MPNITSLLSAPHALWDLYVAHLWRVQPGSWVELAASCFRACAFAAIAPFALLTMLVRSFARSAHAVRRANHARPC